MIINKSINKSLLFIAISEYKNDRANTICQSHYRIAIRTMSIKLQILFVTCIILIFALDVTIGRPDIADTALNPVEDTELDVNEPLEREKRSSCGWSGGCHKGYCWANCKGGFGVLGK